MTQENSAAGAEKVLGGIESARRMGVRFRLTVLVLSLVILLGAILRNVIPYTPVFPVVVLGNALIALVAGVRANWISRGFQQFGGAAAGLAYTSATGGVIMLIFSGFSVVAGAVGGKNSIAGPHGSTLLMALSWPAVVISLVAIGIGIAAFRRIKQQTR